MSHVIVNPARELLEILEEWDADPQSTVWATRKLQTPVGWRTQERAASLLVCLPFYIDLAEKNGAQVKRARARIQDWRNAVYNYDNAWGGRPQLSSGLDALALLATALDTFIPPNAQIVDDFENTLDIIETLVADDASISTDLAAHIRGLVDFLRAKLADDQGVVPFDFYSNARLLSWLARTAADESADEEKKKGWRGAAAKLARPLVDLSVGAASNVLSGIALNALGVGH